MENQIENTYPKIMWVQNTDGEEPVQRVVFAEKCGKYLAWWDAETFEQAEKETRSVTWEFASDTDPRVKEEDEMHVMRREVMATLESCKDVNRELKTVKSILNK